MSEAVKPVESALSPRRIGEQCRATGLGIVNNAHRWGKAELAGWLSGPYRRVTLYATSAVSAATTTTGSTPDPTPQSERAPRSEVTRRHRPIKTTLPYQAAASLPQGLEVADGRVEALLGQLRDEITCLFRGATMEKIDSFSRACLKHGFVTEQFADDATELYLPVDQPRMRLLERVVSLFAADALMWPGSYSTVRICEQCRALTFGNCAHSPSGWRAMNPPIPRED